MKLIPNWRKSWGFWSIRLGVAGTVLTSIFLASPDAALWAWSILPDDLKAHLPPVFVKWVGVSFFVGSMIARVIDQEKLRIKNESSINDNQA